MDEDNRSGFLDELVELVAKAMDAVGLHGRRLRWKWSRRKLAIAEKKASVSVMLRSAKGRHKMCPSCRALVPRSAGKCPECGESLATVRAPGFNRLIANMFPGIGTATPRGIGGKKVAYSQKNTAQSTIRSTAPFSTGPPTTLWPAKCAA